MFKRRNRPTAASRTLHWSFPKDSMSGKAQRFALSADPELPTAVLQPPESLSFSLSHDLCSNTDGERMGT